MTVPTVSFWGPGSSLIVVSLSTDVRFGGGMASFQGQRRDGPPVLRQFHVQLDKLVSLTGVGLDD